MQKQTNLLNNTKGSKEKSSSIPEWLLSLYEKSGITMIKIPTQLR